MKIRLNPQRGQAGIGPIITAILGYVAIKSVVKGAVKESIDESRAGIGVGAAPPTEPVDMQHAVALYGSFQDSTDLYNYLHPDRDGPFSQCEIRRQGRVYRKWKTLWENRYNKHADELVLPVCLQVATGILGFAFVALMFTGCIMAQIKPKDDDWYFWSLGGWLFCTIVLFILRDAALKCKSAFFPIYWLMGLPLGVGSYMVKTGWIGLIMGGWLTLGLLAGLLFVLQRQHEEKRFCKLRELRKQEWQKAHAEEFAARRKQEEQERQERAEQKRQRRTISV